MRILFLVLLTVCSVAMATEVYRWVDDAGEVHYSDRPHEGAVRMALPEAQTFSTPASQSVRRSANEARNAQSDEQEAFSYQSVKIISPTQSQVLWSTGGLVKVTVSVRPNLRRGDTLMIYLDGKMIEGLTGNKRELELKEVYRGDHTLQVEIRDASGNVIGKGSSVTFTVKQTSILNPNNPNVPPVPAPRPGPGG